MNMRKLILISALVLVSAAAQAGQPRGLIVASNDERIESVPDQPKADVKPEASQPATEAAKPEASKTATEAQNPVTEISKPVRKAVKPASTVHAHDYASQEARARSIAARYGISW
jgi:cytoskeletal protein RodZ